MIRTKNQPFREFKRRCIHWIARCFADSFPRYKISNRWIQHSLKHLQRSKRFVPGEVELKKHTFHYPDPVSFAFAWQQIFGHECYRFHTNKKFPRIVDCGANVGLASIYWKTLFPSANITALEADPSIFAYLEKNIKLAGIEDIECLNEAVWHSKGEVQFSSQGADGGSIAKESQYDSTNTIRVKARPLPELLTSERVDLLKIDIEGAEAELLIGHHEWLKNVMRIFVEYHSFPSQTQRLDEILKSLRVAGFRVHLQPELVSPRPFIDVQVNEGMDQRINIYAWRI